MNVCLDEKAKMPVKAHETDAGFDLFSREMKWVYPHNSATFDTGVHTEIPKGCVGFLKSKSGLNVKHSITSDGVIDCGYTGSIVVKLYNNGDEAYLVNEGDKITQLVVLPLASVGDLKLVDTLEETDRGDKGFGSSGN